MDDPITPCIEQKDRVVAGSVDQPLETDTVIFGDTSFWGLVHCRNRPFREFPMRAAVLLLRHNAESPTHSGIHVATVSRMQEPIACGCAERACRQLLRRSAERRNCPPTCSLNEFLKSLLHIKNRGLTTRYRSISHPAMNRP